MSNWYRYEDRRFANPVNEWGEPTGSPHQCPHGRCLERKPR